MLLRGLLTIAAAILVATSCLYVWLWAIGGVARLAGAD